jgi:positive regulator of sigma E activity
MRTDTQQLIIIILGVIAIISILKNYDMIILSTIIGILGGFLTGKTLTEKQQEIIQQQTVEEREDVQ